MIEFDKILTLLKRHLPDLKNRYPIARMGLFGSIVRDDFDPDKSDIDILVEFKGPIGIEFIDLQEELQILAGRKVDLISLRGIKPRYMEQIQEDLIYV